MSDQHVLLFMAGALAPITTEVAFRAVRLSWRKKKAATRVAYLREGGRR